MGDHISDDVLTAFAMGEMGEHLATHVAIHLDHCPTCAARSACLEPMHDIFARSSDPDVPSDLVRCALREAATAHPQPQTTELLLGSALLVAAVTLLFFVGEPLSLVARIGVSLDLLGAAGRALLVSTTPLTLIPLTIAVGIACALVMVQPPRSFGETR